MQGSGLVFVATVAAFISAGLLVGLAVYSLLSPRTVAQRRLREVAAVSSSGLVVQTATVSDVPDPVWSSAARFVPRSPKEMTRLQRRLATAGYQGSAAAVTYSFLELFTPLLAAGGVLLRFGYHSTPSLVGALIAAAVGYFLPGMWVDHRIALRKKQIRNGLPDVVDLVIVCLEAGSSLDQSLVKAGEELGIAYPALAEELRLLSAETRAGKSRIEAFKNLAQRTKVDDVRALVAMLVQTDRFGTSVAQALRTFADTSRTKRRQSAEERAAKVGVKLVFPLVLFLFPAFYVVVLGPAIIQFVRVFFGQVVQQMQ